MTDKDAAAWSEFLVRVAQVGFHPLYSHARAAFDAGKTLDEYKAQFLRCMGRDELAA